MAYESLTMLFTAETWDVGDESVGGETPWGTVTVTRWENASATGLGGI